MTSRDDARLDALRDDIRRFAAERDWNRFHSPKNLSMALAAEAGELLELFQWFSEEQSAALDAVKLEQVSHELADVFIYLLRLSDRLGIDLLDAAEAKLELNARKYPADRVRGDPRKYTEYD